MNAADSRRHQLLPSKMHLFAPLARSSRLTSLKQGWKHLKKHPGSPGKASTVLALFYLQVLAGETVPKGFWGCSMGKNSHWDHLAGCCRYRAVLPDYRNPPRRAVASGLSGDAQNWGKTVVEIPGLLLPAPPRPRLREVEDEPRRDPKSCRDPSPTRASYGEVAPNTPGRKKWD